MTSHKPLARFLLVLGTLWPAAARAETAGCPPGPEKIAPLVAAVGRLARFRVARGSVQSELSIHPGFFHIRPRSF